MKSALISALVALVASAPLSNAASSAVKVVRGKTGPRGATGPVGPRGPAAAPDPSLVHVDQFALNPPRGVVSVDTERTFAAYCPNHGTVGGSFSVIPERAPVRSGISADNTYYYVTFKAGDSALTVRAVATCID